MLQDSYALVLIVFVLYTRHSWNDIDEARKKMDITQIFLPFGILIPDPVLHTQNNYPESFSPLLFSLQIP